MGVPDQMLLHSLVLGNLGTSVGIGNKAPQAKLHVSGGKVKIQGGFGLVLQSINGSCFELRVSDAGALTVTPLVCP